MNYKCQECDHELELMVTYNAEQTGTGKIERLYLCNKCLSTWCVTTDKDGSSKISRYFFG